MTDNNKCTEYSGWVEDLEAVQPGILSRVAIAGQTFGVIDGKIIEECMTVTAEEMQRLSERLSQFGSKAKVCADELRTMPLNYGQPASKRGCYLLRKEDHSRKTRYS